MKDLLFQIDLRQQVILDILIYKHFVNGRHLDVISNKDISSISKRITCIFDPNITVLLPIRQRLS